MAGAPARSAAAVTPGAAVVDHRPDAREQPVMGDRVDRQQVGGSVPPPRSPQPRARMPRWPVRSSAAAIAAVTAAPLRPSIMLPKPMEIGGGPAARKAASSGSGAQPAGRSRNQ